MKNVFDELSVIEMLLMRWTKDMTEMHIARIPLEIPGLNSNLPTERVAGNHLRRLLALQQTLREGSVVIEQMIERTVRTEFPELGGKRPVFYKEWRVGFEETRTGDLFNPTVTPQPKARTKDVISTRSDDIRPNRAYDFRFPLIDPGH